MMNLTFVSIWEAVTKLRCLESVEWDARKNPIGEDAFHLHYYALLEPVNAAGIHRIVRRVTGGIGIHSAVTEWNRWIRGLCPLLGDSDGVVPEPWRIEAERKNNTAVVAYSTEPIKRLIDECRSSTKEQKSTEADERRAVLAQYRSKT